MFHSTFNTRDEYGTAGIARIPRRPNAVWLALIAWIGILSLPALSFADGTIATIKVTKAPEHGGRARILVHLPDGGLPFEHVDVPDGGCSEQTKAELIYKAMRALCDKDKRLRNVVATYDDKLTVTVENLPEGTRLEVSPGGTAEADEISGPKAVQSEVGFKDTFDPYDVHGQPAIFTAGIVTDVGELSVQVSAQELNFQTDGPIICQALFQRLQPRAPQYGAQINYAGDRLEVYFDPAYTTTQGGIIFGTNSPSEGCSGSSFLPPEILYVDAAATGGATGTSWEDAYPRLSDALDDLPYLPFVSEIWVARGAYAPATHGPGDRTGSFGLCCGVDLFGGFNGTEGDRDQRDPVENPTILSGDLNGDDGPHFANREDNSYHVVTADNNGGNSSLLDGFIIRGGNADGDSDGETYFYDAGGAIRIDHAAPTIRNCTITDNYGKFGGGVEIFFGAPVIEDCTFAQNAALHYGGGLHNNRGQPAIRGCTFTGNAAQEYGGAMRFVSAGGSVVNSLIEGNSSNNGGGVALDRSSTPALINVVLRGNEAAGDGGGLHLDRGASPLVASALLEGNRAARNGGGIFAGADGSTAPQLVNVTLNHNRAAHGGGVYVSNAQPAITNSILYFNEDVDGTDESSQLTNSGGTVTLSYSDVQGLTGDFGGAGNLGDDPHFVTAGGWDDNGTPDDPSDDVCIAGDLQLCPGSPCIDRGDSAALPQDSLDLDGDGITSEPLPVDLLGLPRQLDDAGTTDRGAGDLPALDLGPHEFRGTTNVLGDSNGDGTLDFNDIDCFVAALISLEQWQSCSGLTADRYLALNDVNRSGSVDFDDIDFFVYCLINGECQELASLLLWSDQLTYWDVTRSGSETHDLRIFNLDCAPLRLTAVALDGGIDFSIEDYDATIPPYSFGIVPIRFTASQADQYADTLRIETDPPSSQTLEVTIVGHASDAAESDPYDTTRIDVTFDGVLPEDTGVHAFYTIEVPPIGPTQRHLEMRLNIYGDLPPEIEPSFSQDIVELGTRQIANLDLFAPRGTPPQDGQFVVTGDVYEGVQYLFTVSSIYFYCDGAWWDWVQDACDCPKDTPAPSLNVLSTKSFDVPDYMPPNGQTPKQHPVAVATAVVRGPKKGECCKGAKFEMTFTVDSQVGGANNQTSAWFVLSGLCQQNNGTLTADTDGTAQPVVRGPNDGGMLCAALTNDIAAVPRVEVQTVKTVGVKCELDGDKCPCKLAGSKFVTKLKFTMGREDGDLEVHWSISLKGENCVISAVTGTIDQIIFIRSGKVYDPKNDEFDDPTGDDDKDGKSNYDEVKNGTDPKDPKSK